MMRTWVSPAGEVHDISDAGLYVFCKSRKLHYENMLDHIAKLTSDQKNGGWRLIERMKAISHVDRPLHIGWPLVPFCHSPTPSLHVQLSADCWQLALASFEVFRQCTLSPSG